VAARGDGPVPGGGEGSASGYEAADADLRDRLKREPEFKSLLYGSSIFFLKTVASDRRCLNPRGRRLSTLFMERFLDNGLRTLPPEPRAGADKSKPARAPGVFPAPGRVSRSEGGRREEKRPPGGRGGRRAKAPGRGGRKNCLRSLGAGYRRYFLSYAPSSALGGSGGTNSLGRIAQA